MIGLAMPHRICRHIRQDQIRRPCQPLHHRGNIIGFIRIALNDMRANHWADLQQIDANDFPERPISNKTKVMIIGEVEQDFMESPEVDVTAVRIFPAAE